ncbi:hypothetical protein PV10_07823 [Exophiala mesophila]|uniref:BHLH domain-containing protein n=1 Tax=Exophiala mesophila TaxID=212818 RepID=A0A0D1XR29_EXOME|nr:uncharacterized protein PV10_07823 [Exophiala mesophila]KIV90526.1 hypothetical protein PV10_07823 [Exophiala mesophila]
MPQESDQNVIWSQEMQDDHIGVGVGVSDDDFTKFLDLDNDFAQFAAVGQHPSGLDTPMGRLGFGNPETNINFASQDQVDLSMGSGNNAVAFQHGMQPSHAYPHYQQHFQQMQMQPHYHVPPTPVSAEMHAAKYTQHMGNNGQILFDHQQVSFTPLVSPAQTPMDGGFAMSDYGLTDDFFSPLTSPAIEAQNAYNSTTASPIDLNIDIANPKSSTSAPNRARRRLSNNARPASRSVRQSPAVKPQIRRRVPSSNSLALEKAPATPTHPNKKSSDVQFSSAPNSAIFQTSDDSVSPEALSDTAMRPPPIPLSSRSPQPPPMAQKDAAGNPVTPATLMRMPADQNDSSNQLTHHAPAATADELMEDIMLPAAVSGVKPPLLPTLDTSNIDDGESTPIMAAKTAKTSAGSTPRGLLGKMTGQDQFAKPSKIEGRGGRAGKKRQSTSSAAISPALRPKISPSISPLVPATGAGVPHISADASALYLASKSNYQNILEGTHLPGVSYPETLAENLTSKRTSHKIAEQGRRNRINLALKEIESLLPPSISGANVKKEKASPVEGEDVEGKASAAAQGASKASTVEMAITYIKSLQSELAETKEKLEAAEKRLADGTSSAGSQASEG